MKKILFVDDSEVIRMEARVHLEAGGFQVVEARNGVDALDAARDNPDICMVLVDYNMPGMNGIEMITLLRKSEGFEEIPVIVLSAQMLANLKKVAQEHKISGWALKPAKWDLLLREVGKLSDKHLESLKK